MKGGRHGEARGKVNTKETEEKGAREEAEKRRGGRDEDKGTRKTNDNLREQREK